MNSIEIGELKSALANDVGQDLETAILDAEPPQLHSPDLLDLVLWNVVVAFVLSFASNLAAMALPRKSTLTFADLQAIRKVTQSRAEITAVPDRTNVTRVVFEALPASIPDAERRALAARLTESFMDSIGHV